MSLFIPAAMVLVCFEFDTPTSSDQVCVDLVYTADTILDTASRDLAVDAGPGHMTVGYVDPSDGRFVAIAAQSYDWRSYDRSQRVLYLVVDDVVSSLGFEDGHTFVREVAP